MDSHEPLGVPPPWRCWRLRSSLLSLLYTQDERAAIIRDDLKPGSPEDERDWDVLLTTYEIANIEKTALNKIGWRYLIIDEAHRYVGVPSVSVPRSCVASVCRCGRFQRPFCSIETKQHTEPP